MIGTEVARKSGHASDGLFEHAAECLTVDNASMDPKANDPTGVVVHNHEHPMRP